MNLHYTVTSTSTPDGGYIVRASLANERSVTISPAMAADGWHTNKALEICAARAKKEVHDSLFSNLQLHINNLVMKMESVAEPIHVTDNITSVQEYRRRVRLLQYIKQLSNIGDSLNYEA